MMLFLYSAFYCTRKKKHSENWKSGLFFTYFEGITGYKYKVSENANIEIYLAKGENHVHRHSIIYSKTCLKRPLKRRPKIGFQD